MVLRVLTERNMLKGTAKTVYIRSLDTVKPVEISEMQFQLEMKNRDAGKRSSKAKKV